MARLAVVTSSPLGIEGGHLVIARALVQAARDCGHDARLIITPDHGFGRQTISYWDTWRTRVPADVDQVISLRYPSYAVSHPAHVCWLNHTMREYYDLWPRFSATLSARNRVKEGIRRRLTHAIDRWLLKHHVTRVVAQSGTIQQRLAADFGLRAPVLWPPPPQRAYRCERYGDEILLVSRLTPLKRVDLFLRALAEPAARGIRAAVAGGGEQRTELEVLARDLGVAGRVAFLGRIDDGQLLDRLARCRAVCFPPLAEDYGFVTVEAFASHKAVITCRDSGGPTELVHDEETGLICDPTPASLAAAMARLCADATLAESLGALAAVQAATMSWPDAVARLVIV